MPYYLLNYIWVYGHYTQTFDFFGTPKMRLFWGILDKVVWLHSRVVQMIQMAIFLSADLMILLYFLCNWNWNWKSYWKWQKWYRVWTIKIEPHSIKDGHISNCYFVCTLGREIRQDIEGHTWIFENDIQPRRLLFVAPRCTWNS